MFVLFIVGAKFAIVDYDLKTGFSLMIGGLVFGAAAMTWFYSGSTASRNKVVFSEDEVIHNERSYEISRVTRFDYGAKSQLMGIMPRSDESGGTLSDPNVIRMWIDDASSVTISENNWERGVNHQIHHALTSAWQKMVKDQTQKEQEEKFGAIGDDGVPDYD